ncbi:hypothetical protein H7U37_13415 [Pseudoflavonifractor phocaeensis]|uniref:hypothetical protein n=1 Tax=Pseudoflavonifractor phocaeensis TaxID=1870988 RepID=UPI00195CB962|nr:hypothetical protein [Pseudoflavonifractor phocaeensis]MBM6939506.1 hypothetical protein [Pseudoflavonifractor phocaeensis]
MVTDRVFETDLAVGFLHLFDAPDAGFPQLIRVDLYVGGQDISHEVLVHRQLEQQVSHPFTECIQLAFQHIGQDAGQVSIGRFRIQIAGVETNGLFDKFISGGAVISPVARFHLGPGGFTEPDGMFLVFLFQIQNPLFIASAPPESLSQRGFRRLLRKNSANLKSGWSEQRQLQPLKPPALRAEVTAQAQQKRQGFLLLFLSSSVNQLWGGKFPG